MGGWLLARSDETVAPRRLPLGRPPMRLFSSGRPRSAVALVRERFRPVGPRSCHGREDRGRGGNRERHALKRRTDLSQTGNGEQPGAADSDEQDVDPAVSSPAEQAQERQDEMEESGQENPA
jgi:hypothetical protein